MSKQDDRNNTLLETPSVDGDGLAGGDGREMDAATLSVSNALRTSFLALKIVLVGLVVLYLGSGYFTLPPGSQAVVVQFGKIQGQDSAAGPVLQPGPHWAWPWPISQVVTEDTEKPRALTLSFMFYVPDQYRGRKIEELGQFAPTALTPGVDGYLLTGEQEIVHLECAIKYRVDDLVAYATQLNNSDVDPQSRLAGDQKLLRDIGQWACTRTIATMRTDPVVRGERDTIKENIKRLMQERLDKVGSGLSVVDIIVDQPTVPLQVRPFYLQVVGAESEKAKAISTARTQATQQLNEMAGPSHEDLQKAIQAYEKARATGETAVADTQMKQILSLVDAAGGMVASMIGQAMAERSRLELAVRAEVRRFQDLYDKYQANPHIFIAQLWADAKADIMDSNKLEVIYLPMGSKEIRMTLDHNPEFLKAKERDKYQQQVSQGG